jgi:hypothetical protein
LGCVEFSTPATLDFHVLRCCSSILAMCVRATERRIVEELSQKTSHDPCYAIWLDTRT